MRGLGVQGGEPAAGGRTAARARARARSRGRGGGSVCPLHGSAAGQPHSPRPRPRAAITAAVATAAAPSTAAAPDDDRAAILDALRQLRKGTRARGTAARARRRRRSGIAPGAEAGPHWRPRKLARPLRRQRRIGEGGSRVRRGAWAPLETPTVPDAAGQRAEARPRSPAEPPVQMTGRVTALVCCPSPQTVNLSCRDPEWGGACVCSLRSVGSYQDECASCSHLCKEGKSCPGVRLRARPLPPACLRTGFEPQHCKRK